MKRASRIRMSVFTLCAAFLPMGCGSKPAPVEAAVEQPPAGNAELFRKQIDAALQSKDAGAATSIATSLQESLGEIEKQNPDKSANVKRLRELAGKAATAQAEEAFGLLPRMKTELASLK